MGHPKGTFLRETKIKRNAVFRRIEHKNRHMMLGGMNRSNPQISRTSLYALLLAHMGQKRIIKI